MKKRVLRTALFGLLLCSMALGSTALAQDFNADLSRGLSLTQQMLSEVQAAQGAGDVAGRRSGAAAALTTGQQAAAALESARALATTDPDRSRAEGLLQHVQAANLALTQAQTVSDNEVAARLNAARGEIEEALAEFPAVQPSVLPKAGDSGTSSGLTALAAGGLGLLTLGAIIRLYGRTRPSEI